MILAAPPSRDCIDRSCLSRIDAVQRDTRNGYNSGAQLRSAGAHRETGHSPEQPSTTLPHRSPPSGPNPHGNAAQENIFVARQSPRYTQGLWVVGATRRTRSGDKHREEHVVLIAGLLTSRQLDRRTPVSRWIDPRS